MKEKIKTQKGFIQIHLLIWIIAFLVTVSAVGTGVILHEQGKLKFTANISESIKETIETPEPMSEPTSIPTPTPTHQPTSQEEVFQTEQGLEQAKLEDKKAQSEAERLKTEQKAEKIKTEIERAKEEANAEAEVEVERLKVEQEDRKIIEEQKPYIAPPTLEQLSNLRRVCLWDARLKAICNDPNFMPGYYSNLVFRTKLDDMIKNFLVAMSDQQKQRIVAEKSIMDCLMTPSSEEERLLDPDTKMYLLQLRCGTVTATDRTNYELSRLKSSVGELKYRLDSKISFPSLYLNPIKTPTFSIPRWQIRWEGSGGTVTDSSGNFYQFHCENNTCRSY